MKENCNFDERQLWVRGDIFKHTVIVMGGLLLLNSFLMDYGVSWADGMYPSMIILLISIMTLSVEMICRNVYPSVNNNQKIPIYLIGILSTVSLAWTVIESNSLEIKLVVSGQLSEYGSRLIMNSCMFIIFAVFIVKTVYEKRFEKEVN